MLECCLFAYKSKKIAIKTNIKALAFVEKMSSVVCKCFQIDDICIVIYM